MTPDLRRRAVHAQEAMDLPDADERMLERTYRRFGAVNAIVSRPGLRYRSDVRSRARREGLRILDVGAGGGDLCRNLAARLHRDGLSAEITALDPDARAMRWAAAHDGGAGVIYRRAHTADLVASGEIFDIVLSNHLLHHLAPYELQRLLADSLLLAAPTGLVVHSDIARGRAAYVLFAVATWPFAGSLLAGSFIRSDGLTSIRRSYTPDELDLIVPGDWTIRTGMPSRLELRWEGDGAGP